MVTVGGMQVERKENGSDRKTRKGKGSHTRVKVNA